MAFPDVLQEKFVEQMSRRIYYEVILGFKKNEAHNFIKEKTEPKGKEYRMIKEIVGEEMGEYTNPNNRIKR